MMKISQTKHGKKVYGDAVAKAKSKAIHAKIGKKKSYPWQGDTDKSSKPYTFRPKNS